MGATRKRWDLLDKDGRRDPGTPKKGSVFWWRFPAMARGPGLAPVKLEVRARGLGPGSITGLVIHGNH